MTHKTDHTAAFAEAFYIANLLFIGVFYLALWILYLRRYKNASTVAKNHLKQTLVASTISTIIFVAINLIILSTSGYHSVGALLALETYFMIIVPIFFLAGILGFTKAIRGVDFRYPLIGKHIKLATTA